MSTSAHVTVITYLTIFQSNEALLLPPGGSHGGREGLPDDGRDLRESEVPAARGWLPGTLVSTQDVEQQRLYRLLSKGN